MAPFYIKDNLYNEPFQGTAELFYDLTGALWTDEMILSEEVDAEAKQTVSAAEYEIQRFLTPLYQAYKRRAPRLFLLQGVNRGCHSVYAMDGITKGTIVTEFLGQWAPLRSKPSSYRFGTIDGLHIRNLGPMVEDGFPNVAAFHLYNIGGIPKRVVFVALENIAASEMIAVDYRMNHSVKMQYHIEYRFDQLLDFFSKHSFHKILLRIKELQRKPIRELRWKGVLEFENLSAKISYLFQTPSALFLLLTKHPGWAKELREIFFEPEYRYYVLGFPFQQNYRQKEVAECIALIFDYFEKGLANPSRDYELCLRLRQRIFYRVFLQGVLAGGDFEKEAWIWNETFDAIQKGDRALVAFKIELALKTDELIQEACFYAKEIQSPLLPWLQSFAEPPLPLSPTG